MDDEDWSSPNCVAEITEEWAYRLIDRICQLSPEDRKAFNITSVIIDSNLNSGEGALSDICHVSAKVKIDETFSRQNSDENYGKKNENIVGNHLSDRNINDDFSTLINGDSYHIGNGHKNGFLNNETSFDLFIKLIPEDLKELIGRHGLFEREITFYRYFDSNSYV